MFKIYCRWGFIRGLVARGSLAVWRNVYDVVRSIGMSVVRNMVIGWFVAVAWGLGAVTNMLIIVGLLLVWGIRLGLGWGIRSVFKV